MTAPYSDLGSRGSLTIKKISGSGSFSGQVVVPSAFVQPTSPFNIQYPGCINSSDNESVEILGNITPACVIRTYAKATWWTAALIKSMLITLDGNGNTDLFAVRIKSQFTDRTWDQGRFTGMIITQSAQGGPLILDMGFISIYDDLHPAGVPTTFSSPATDAGSLIHKAQVAWTGADQTKGSTLSLSRVQAYQFSDTGVLTAEAISSGKFSASLMITQAATYGTTPGSSATVAYGGTGAGVSLAMLLNLDNPFQPQDEGFTMHSAGYRCIDISGGTMPITVTAL